MRWKLVQPERMLLSVALDDDVALPALENAH